MLLASLEDASRREEIRERLSTFHPQVVRRWGVLTPCGVICHLSLSFEMAAGNLKCSTRTGPVQRSVLRYIGLHVPVPWPRDVPTLPELVEGTRRVRSTGFEHDRACLLAAYERFVASTALTAVGHPIFGPLTHWEWMRWGYLHADHHLRQFGL